MVSFRDRTARAAEEYRRQTISKVKDMSDNEFMLLTLTNLNEVLLHDPPYSEDIGYVIYLPGPSITSDQNVAPRQSSEE